MNETSVTQETESKQEAKEKDTFSEDLIDDVTHPLSTIRNYMRTVELSGKDGSVYIADILVQDAEKRLEEIVNALEAKFGKIQIEHENYDPNKVLFPWGKVVGVIVKKGEEV